jgi:hypothetical protein
LNRYTAGDRADRAKDVRRPEIQIDFGPGAARDVADQALATIALTNQRRRVNSGVRSTK